MITRRGRALLICSFIALLTMALLARDAVADPPSILRNYRLISRLSSLQVTGGFAGVNQEYRLKGTFGLLTDYVQNPVVDSLNPVLVPHAQFVDVDIDAFWNHPAALVPLLNLEEHFVDLESLWSFYDTPPVLKFVGKDLQGARFELQATLHGRLIHLQGHNTPPCCDFFDYKIDAYAHLDPFADFNLDGVTNAADYTRWRDNLGMTSGAELEQGDADGDGDVDDDDFLAWKSTVGTISGFTSLNDLPDNVPSAALVAPEPSSPALAVGLFYIMVLLNRPRASYRGQ